MVAGATKYFNANSQNAANYKLGISREDWTALKTSVGFTWNINR